MKGTTQRPNDAKEEKEGPLALHIRRFRLWYDGKRSLKQHELAKLSGVSPRQIRRYETATDLPHEIASVLRLALALRMPVEALVREDWLRTERDKIDERRADLGPAEPYGQ
jgi:transcriptional regulator with XRE-family HTH domain